MNFKKHVFAVVLWLPSLVYSQLERKEIQFESGLTWEQIKERAKSENKYVFVDCYATWCGPCKKMDKDVYTNDTVIDYCNDKFISVKVQMDQTKKDDEQTKNWYKDADLLATKYRITGYPTQLFFFPDGKIVDKQVGYKTVGEFMKMAEGATVPGKIYDDPYATYDSLVKEYKKGNKDYSIMPYLIKTSLSIGDKELARIIGKDYVSYLMQGGEDKLYTKENIDFFTSTYVIGSSSKLFKLFYPDGHKVDSIMSKKGFAVSVVDKTIQREMVDSFTNTKSSGWQIVDESQKYPEINWSKLYETIKQRYNAVYAERNVLDGKIRWCRFKDKPLFIKSFIERMRKFGSDTTDGDKEVAINDCAYVIYENSTDMKQIRTAIQWMEGVIRRNPTEESFMDTYACLLYKSGKTKEGIRWEEKALATTKAKPAEKVYPGDIELFEGIIKKMKDGDKLPPPDNSK